MHLNLERGCGIHAVVSRSAEHIGSIANNQFSVLLFGHLYDKFSKIHLYQAKGEHLSHFPFRMAHE